MKDPTRIPAVLEELRTTWEGQPNLGLATLFGVLQNRGIGWGSDDAELVEALRDMQRINPPRIGPDLSARYVIDTIGPDTRVTIDPFRVVVRRLLDRGEHTQPGVWDYNNIVRCEVGSPLVISDREDFRHRLGVVATIELVNDTPLAVEPDLTGLSRELIGDRIVLLELSDDITVILDRSLNVFAAGRRTLEHTTHKWDRILQARPGQLLRVTQPGNSGVLELGNLERCFFIEG